MGCGGSKSAKADAGGAPAPAPAAAPAAAAAGGVKVFAMPPSANAIGPVILAMDAGAGALELCDLMKGEQNTPEFLAMNPFHHIPTLKDGNFAIGESIANLRYLAIKYKKEYYPVDDAATCGMIDFAAESFSNEVYPKLGPKVIYGVAGFAPAPEDQATANKEATDAIATWMTHFVKGKYAVGDKITIADFKAVPFLFASMQPVIEKKTGFVLSDRAKQYVEDFMAAVKSTEIMKSAGGFSIVEYIGSKDPDAGEPSKYTKVDLTAAPPLGQPDGKVKVHGMPPSANAVGPTLLAMDAGCGGFEMCNLMEGAQNKPEFLALNPFHHIPTVQDGAFAIGESGACLRYLALKYKKAYYPVEDPQACGLIDFALESFANEVYKKIGGPLIYPVLGFAGPAEDKEKALKEANEAVDTWVKHFLKGKFVNGDKISIADFKAVPFFFYLMQPVMEEKTGFKLSDTVKTYVNNFIAAVGASAFMKEAGGYSIVEFAASKA